MVLPLAIGIGFGSAVLFVYAHLLPTFLPGYQDSFVSGPRINVTWFSWLTAVAEIGTGLVLGYVGLRSLREPRRPAKAVCDLRERRASETRPQRRPR
jgi:hypothetical protein